MLERAHTVTFDCWQTLIYEHRVGPGSRARIDMLAAAAGEAPERVEPAFAAAWKEHQRAWHRRIAFGGPEITAAALRAMGSELSAAQQAELVSALEDELLAHDIRAIDGARELLFGLRAAGVRTALICDTGFSPGRVVRKLLDRLGLLEHLEVQIFSNEVRVPKPDPRAFHAALQGLGVSAHGAVHIGDLRRSDIAGARAVGMGSVRFAGRNDDLDAAAAATAGILDCDEAGCEPTCERPEADLVVRSYAELAERLKLG